jgi:protein arginine kinase activator
MLCQSCKENQATVHVTEVVHGATAEGEQGLEERHLCEVCAQAANLPHATVIKKSVAEIWKLLQASAQRGRKEPGITCPDCGLTLAEFRQRGRLGCPRDYDVFMPQLRDLLERIHGATRHSGRVPGLDEPSMERLQRVNELQRQLDAAIRDEAYEAAAQLRDELKSLQSQE